MERFFYKHTVIGAVVFFILFIALVFVNTFGFIYIDDCIKWQGGTCKTCGGEMEYYNRVNGYVYYECENDDSIVYLDEVFVDYMTPRTK